MKTALVILLLSTHAYAAPDETPAPAPTPTPAPTPSIDSKTLRFDTSKVEKLFDEGTKHYDLGQYDAAIVAFKQAYALMPDPSFLYNIGQSYRQKNSCRDATAAYQSYLRDAPDEDRQKVEQFIRDLADCVKHEDERERLLVPVPKLVVSPRMHRIRLAGIATTGAGALLIGGAVFFTARSIGAANDLERACANECNASEVASIDRRGHSASRNATVLYSFGAGAVAAGVAMIFYTVLRDERVTVTPSAGGAVVSTMMRF